MGCCEETENLVGFNLCRRREFIGDVGTWTNSKIRWARPEKSTEKPPEMHLTNKYHSWLVRPNRWRWPMQRPNYYTLRLTGDVSVKQSLGCSTGMSTWRSMDSRPPKKKRTITQSRTPSWKIMIHKSRTRIWYRKPTTYKMPSRWPDLPAGLIRQKWAWKQLLKWKITPLTSQVLWTVSIIKWWSLESNSSVLRTKEKLN